MTTQTSTANKVDSFQDCCPVHGGELKAEYDFGRGDAHVCTFSKCEGSDQMSHTQETGVIKIGYRFIDQLTGARMVVLESSERHGDDKWLCQKWLCDVNDRWADICSGDYIRHCAEDTVGWERDK